MSKQQADAIGSALTAPGKGRQRRRLVPYPELSAYPLEERSDRLRDAMSEATRSWPVLAAFAVVFALVAAVVVIFLLKREAGPLALFLLFVAGGLLQRVHQAQIRKNLRAGRGAR